MRATVPSAPLMRGRLPAALCLLGAALGLSGCGLGGGQDAQSPSQGVTLRVTEDFGSERVAVGAEPRAAEGDTIARLVGRLTDLDLGDDGTVEGIEGRSGGEEDGRTIGWSAYVNGVAPNGPPARSVLAPGDRVWWDLHDQGAAPRVPAVVGSFPEPFRSGLEGKRIPARIECAEPSSRECDEVGERLERAGVAETSRSVLSQREEGGVLRVLVGRWSQLRLDPVAQQIERGPRVSGVFARFEDEGRRLILLDEEGRPARTLEAGAGLIAATRQGDSRPTWVVTGTDAVGLAAATGALQERLLAQRFAVALDGGQAISAPVTTPGFVP